MTVRGGGFMDWVARAAQADEFVAYYQDSTDLVLDYSAASLAHVDALLDDLREKRTDPADVGDLVVGVASYVGEVIRRTLDGAWIADADVAAGGGAMFNPAIAVGPTSLRPVEQVCQRIGTGAGDPLSSLYATLAQATGGDAQRPSS